MDDFLRDFATPVGEPPIKPEDDFLLEFASLVQEEKPTLKVYERQQQSREYLQRQEARRQRQLEQTQARAQEVESILRHPFDYTEKFSSSAASSDFILETDMARSKDFASARSKFLKQYPEGDYRVMSLESGGQAKVARRNPDEPYRELRTSSTVASVLFSEHMALGAIGSFFSPLGSAVGVAAGEIAQRAIEGSRGYEQQRPAKTTISHALREGAVAGGIDLATRRLLRFFGMSPIQQDSLSAIEVQARLARATDPKGVALEGIAVGQTGGTFQRGIFFQVGATSSRVEEKLLRQRRSVYDLFVAEADNIPVGALSDDALDSIAEIARRNIETGDTLSAISRPRTGETIREGLETWRRASREAVDRLYDDAIALSDNIAFDLSPAQAAVANIRRGEYGRGRPAQQQSPVLGPDGLPLQTEVIPDIRLPEGQSSILEEVLTTISRLDPNVSTHVVRGSETTGFQQIKRLRTRLFDLKEQPNIDPDVRRHANELWSVLTDVINNPTGGAQSADFSIAWRAASEAHRETETVLRRGFIRRALNEDTTTPELLAGRYARPGNETELAELKRLLPEESWQNFKSYAMDDLVSSVRPQAAINRLDDFRRRDMAGLRLLMTEAEEQQARRYLLTAMQEQSAPWTQVRTKAMGDADRALEILNRSTPSELEAFIRQAGGMASDQGQALRAAVYRDILTSGNATTQMQGQSVVRPETIYRNIQNWKNSGKLKNLFTETDWQMITDIQSYTSYISEAGDIGGGMMAGALRQKALGSPFERPGVVVASVVKPLLTNDTVAFVLSRNITRNNYRYPISVDAERRLRWLTMATQMAYRNYEAPELEGQQ